MNDLAHIFLAGHGDEAMLGALCGDKLIQFVSTQRAAQAVQFNYQGF